MTTQEAASNNEDAAPVQTRLTFFPQQRSSQQAGLLAAMAAILLVPAIWNGFPFVFPDTGGYLVRPFTGTLELGRSALYGAFLAAGIALDFWPNVIVQALIGAWTISLVLRMQGLRHPALQIAVVAALCVGTSLPWHAGQLEPDVFLPLAVLAVYLMAFAAPQLSRWDIALLAAVVAFAIAAHTSILAVLLLLLAFLALLWLAAPRLSQPRPRLIVPAASLVAGAVLALASNDAMTGQAAFTPGGSTFLFGRLLKDGFVKTYLDRNCPNPTLSLCHYRDTLPTPTESDYWLWGSGSPLNALGGWRAFTPEADRIIIGSIVEQPGAHVVAILKGTFAQLATVATGDGFDADNDAYNEQALTEYAPRSLQRFKAARQQRDAIDFHVINRLHVPLALGATLLLPVLVVLCWRRRADAALLGLIVFAALVANATVCATFSGVEDRYQSRIVSIAVLAAALACLELLPSRRDRQNNHPPN
jgi:hypothetical protein